MQFVFILFIALFPFAVTAQDTPIEITADNALEWDRDASTFIARGNGMAVQGETSLRADILTATYTEKESGLSIQKIIASGGEPTVETAKETLTADQITAHFSPDTKTQLEKVIAKSNVTIKTETETLTGDMAEYHPQDQKAIVTGNVKIIDGKNILNGDIAEFDMKTNTSTLKSNKVGGRVKAVFGGAQ